MSVMGRWRQFVFKSIQCLLLTIADSHDPVKLSARLSILLGVDTLIGEQDPGCSVRLSIGAGQSRAKVGRAAFKADWQEKRFDAVPGETEFIPLPGK